MRRETVERASRVFAAVLVCWYAPLALAQLREPTTDTSIGVFYLPGAPGETNLWRDGDEGARLYLEGRLLTRDSTPIEGALVELWHADAFGGVDERRYRTAQLTGEDGSFRVKTVLPGYIPRAVDYPVFAPRHIHIAVTHDDHPQLISLIYFKGDDRLEWGTPHRELAIALERMDGASAEPTVDGAADVPTVDGAPPDAPIEVYHGRVEIVLRDRGEAL